MDAESMNRFARRLFTLEAVVDGLGFERICAVLQGKTSNYDTDVFMPILSAIAERSSEVESYETAEEKQQIAVSLRWKSLDTIAKPSPIFATKSVKDSTSYIGAGGQ